MLALSLAMHTKTLSILCVAMLIACTTEDGDRDGNSTPPEAADGLDDEPDTEALESLDDENDDDDVDEGEDDDVDDADDAGIDEADDPRLADAVDPQAAANTDPLLKWVLYAQPGTARLVQVNPVTGVATTSATHAFATHWLPIGVANDKLLWQRTDTGETTLWTIAANGSFVSQVAITPPASTWRARGISLDQEGACPLPADNQRTYSILWEGPAPGGWLAQWPKPRITHHNHLGAQSSAEDIPERYSWTELREFRHSIHGYSALIHRPTLQVVGGDNTHLTWYGRDANGVLQRLRTDTYTAAGGYTGCTAHQPNVLCWNDFVDEAPGAGHSLTSLVTTANVGGLQTPATYLLWSKSDGTAKNYRVSLYGGQLLGPSAPIITPHVGSTAVSLTGQAPNFCPIFVDPVDPPEWPSDPVLDPPGCPQC